MEPFIMYQDNRSVMLLVNNGKASRSKRTKHIRIRYFFIQDKINQGEISIEHRPTDQMWIDINLKPKQGQLFRQFCSKLMGVPEDYNDDDYKQAHQITVKALIRASSSPQECVGERRTNEAQLCHVELSKPLIQMVQGRRWSPQGYTEPCEYVECP